ncbi:hypothetical protein ANCCAN_16546 [Ancylostoma caninum]|uniref:Uncharacterized protein n=1 Tax=Ancylostoma caninum TaxID=29170 RepID=A0A368FZJ7_ANCCA|nr:hypothetical protein ANCCAN_16546 [Ancylostoma caninum]
MKQTLTGTTFRVINPGVDIRRMQFCPEGHRLLESHSMTGSTNSGIGGTLLSSAHASIIRTALICLLVSSAVQVW